MRLDNFVRGHPLMTFAKNTQFFNSTHPHRTHTHTHTHTPHTHTHIHTHTDLDYEELTNDDIKFASKLLKVRSITPLKATKKFNKGNTYNISCKTLSACS